MSVLLTGGAGYIGSHTCVELLDAGYEVVVVDNYVNSQYEAIRRVEQITGKSVKTYEADVCDREAMDKLFAAEKIDSVIHFAGLKAVGESVAQPMMYYRNNIDATLTLCEMMEKYGVKRIVFSSSATVYGTPDSSPIAEDARTGLCSNPYGWTKYMIEQMLRDWAVAHPELSVVLLRYFNPVGAHPSGLIGENPNGKPNNLMPNVLNAASGKMKELKVFGSDYDTPDGTCVRDYIHVVDLAKGHVCALKYAAENTGAEAINLGTGTGYSVLDIINTFEQSTGVKVPYVLADRRPGDIASNYSNPTKAAEKLHWKAEKTLDDMCRDSWAFKVKNPNGYDA